MAWEISKAVEFKKKIVAVKTDPQNATPSGMFNVGTKWACVRSLFCTTFTERALQLLRLCCAWAEQTGQTAHVVSSAVLHLSSGYSAQDDFFHL